MPRQARTHATLNNWTPKRAHTFSVRRLERINHALEEIAYTYGDVDNSVVVSCDDMIAQLKELRARIDEALQDERSL